MDEKTGEEARATADAKLIFEWLGARLPGAVLETFAGGGGAGAQDAFVKVAPPAIVDILAALRDEPRLRFDFLQNLTVVDWPKRGVFECVYHLFSYPFRRELAVKTELPRERPRVASAAALWKNAGWLEREQYDLFGVVFEGHPDLRRLLLPDDWVGHPMRKDYVEAAAYRGMPTSRPSPLDLLREHDRAARDAAAARGGKAG
jgi:NADH-quinone oxidoreductase subunit C